LLSAADQSAENPISSVEALHLDRQRPAEQAFEIDGSVVALQFEIELKRLPERLPVATRLQLKQARPQRGIDQHVLEEAGFVRLRGAHEKSICFKLMSGRITAEKIRAGRGTEARRCLSRSVFTTQSARS